MASMTLVRAEVYDASTGETVAAYATEAEAREYTRTHPQFGYCLIARMVGA